MRQRRDDLVAHLLLLAAVLAVGWPVLAGGTLYYGDITLQFVPWRAFARAEMLRGVLPLWLPDVYCGTPFLANDQSALLYPLHLLALPLSAPATIALGYLLHLYLSAAGGYAFARRLGRSPVAALVAGLSYGLGGYVVSKQQFPSLAYTIAWLPWLFWAARRLQTEPGPRSLVLAAGVVALQWLSGHAQMSVMQLALATLWVLAAPEA
ncbi:MAG: hypothetical protein HUU35_19055, partial [Armatimonadetes bacterium]|nr:hypothetical protein [Armatimonadota bacterium]